MGKNMRARLITGLVAVSTVLIQPVMGQRPGNPPAGGGGNLPGGSTGTNRTTTTLPPQMPGSSPGMTTGGIYLSGKVVMEDGTPPPRAVVIEKVCSMSQRAQAYTDAKGRFSFQLGDTAGVMQDASEEGPGGMGGPAGMNGQGGGMSGMSGTRRPSGPEMRLATCELRAVLPGYRSDHVDLAGRRLLDNPDVGTIVLHRLGNVEGTVISMTSMLAPKAATKAYNKGRHALQKRKLNEAEADFQKAVNLYPKYAEAWYELGLIQEQNKNAAEARKSYGSALAADPKFMSPYPQLAGLAAREQKWAESADITDRLLKLDPVDYPIGFLLNAMANLNLGRIEAAEKSARAGAKLDAQHQYPKFDEVLAMALARNKDYAGAARHLRNYLQLAPAAEDAPRMKMELAELERLSGPNQQAASQPGGQTTQPEDAHPKPPQ
jgi:tetratricopeptide (TPR) repeat protein